MRSQERKKVILKLVSIEKVELVSQVEITIRITRRRRLTDQPERTFHRRPCASVGYRADCKRALHRPALQHGIQSSTVRIVLGRYSRTSHGPSHSELNQAPPKKRSKIFVLVTSAGIDQIVPWFLFARLLIGYPKHSVSYSTWQIPRRAHLAASAHNAQDHTTAAFN